MNKLEERDIIKPDWKTSAFNKGRYYAPDFTELGKELWDKARLTDTSMFYTKREIRHKGYAVTIEKFSRSDYTVGDLIKVRIKPGLLKKIELLIHRIYESISHREPVRCRS